MSSILFSSAIQVVKDINSILKEQFTQKKIF